MKSFSEIKEQIETGDLQRVADELGVSKSLVSQVLDEKRTDRRNIQLAFNILLKQREDFKKRIRSLKPEAKSITKTVAA